MADMGPVAKYDGSGVGPLAQYDGRAPGAVVPAIQHGDKIKVSVYGEDNLNGIYEVDPSGSVTIPLAGTVSAAGGGKREMQGGNSRRYKSEDLQEPQGTGEGGLFRPIYIFRGGGKTGEKPYPSGLN